jgi:hypothetical protein
MGQIAQKDLKYAEYHIKNHNAIHQLYISYLPDEELFLFECVPNYYEIKFNMYHYRKKCWLRSKIV